MKTLDYNSFITTKSKGFLSLSSPSYAILTPHLKLFDTVDQVGAVVRLGFL